MFTLKKETEQAKRTDIDKELLMMLKSSSGYHKSVNSIDLEKAVDQCVKEYGAEYTAKLIVYARDNNFKRMYCLDAAVFLIKYLKDAEFAKFFFTRRVGETGGIIKEIKDIMTLVNFYLLHEARRREQVTTKDIPYPNPMRKGIRSALENFKWLEFVEYSDLGFEKGIKIKDIIKYFHPNPQKSIATESIPLEDYISHLNDEEKYSREIEKAKAEAVDGFYEIDIFHAILYGFIPFDSKIMSINSIPTEISVDFSDINIVRENIKSIVLKSDNF
jgi:hypothetical protein